MSNQPENVIVTNNDTFIIDDNKFNNIIKRIIKLENENVRKGDHNEENMKKEIEKIIEEELKCC